MMVDAVDERAVEVEQESNRGGHLFTGIGKPRFGSLTICRGRCLAQGRWAIALGKTLIGTGCAQTKNDLRVEE